MGFISDRIASLKLAYQGLKRVFIEEDNFKIHVHAAIITIIISYFFKINKTEWLIILLCIALVLVLEIINTAIENLADLSEQHNQKIKYIKDISAAAVLLASIISFIIGLIIFVPYILKS